MGASETVIKDRLKKGQCIHCGVQTHTVKKNMLGLKSKATPLTVPGLVEGGRCLQNSCLAAGSNVQVTPSSPTPPKTSSVNAGKIAQTVAQTGAAAVGAVAGVAAACLGVPDLVGVIGQGVASSMAQQPQPNPYQDYLNAQAQQQQYNPYQGYLAQQQQVNPYYQVALQAEQAALQEQQAVLQQAAQNSSNAQSYFQALMQEQQAAYQQIGADAARNSADAQRNFQVAMQEQQAALQRIMQGY